MNDDESNTSWHWRHQEECEHRRLETLKTENREMGLSKLNKPPTGGTYELPDVGMTPALLVWCIDCGTQETNYGEKEQMLLFFQVQQRTSDDKPMLVRSRPYNVSMNEKANLRIDLEAWRGKAFTADEIKAFSFKKLMGQPCMLNIVAGGDDGQYRNIGGITPMPNGVAALEQDPDVRQLYFDLDAPDWDAYEELPEWLKSKIADSPEYKKELGLPQPAKTAPAADTGTEPSDDFDDDLPF